MNWNRIRTFCLVGLGVAASATGSFADDKPFRLGIIGLDTSHVIHFTKYFNDPANKTGCKVVAAYRGGSPDIPDSANRLDKFTNELKEKHGVEIVDSIEELCKKVDGILLESVDGRPHLEQARPVFAAGKSVFIDKPVAGSLADAVEIFQLAKASGVPCWTSSTWRFTEGVQAVKKGKVGDVIGCIAFGPCTIEPHHPDFYWYGIHTVETLFTLMGTGCETVARTSSDAADVAVGQWKDGRIGIFRGHRPYGKAGFLVFGSKGNHMDGHDGGYPMLLREIVKFFKTGKAPVPPEETLELFAFMSAADESKANGGVPVKLDDVLDKAKAEVKARTAAKKKR
ncbi:MAG: Gfo/Idh/MocA family oxidoreductase [Pirellulales bacterium]|nr:Gfo/Idh/MocA family oxidoreductase [Pirellulales bacterium]